MSGCVDGVNLGAGEQSGVQPKERDRRMALLTLLPAKREGKKKGEDIFSYACDEGVKEVRLQYREWWGDAARARMVRGHAM